MRLALRRVVGTGSVMALLMLGTYFAAPAAAVNLSCGAVVTQSTVLSNNIVCPAGATGITVQGNGITLNLNGHKVTGVLESRVVSHDPPDPTSSPTNQQMPNPPVTYTVQFAPQQSVGILVIGNGNVVRNGTTERFAAGMFVTGGNRNHVRNMTVRDNNGPPGTDVFGDGILVTDSDANVIANSTVQRNGPFGGVTLLGDSIRNQVVGNRILDNYRSELCANPAGCGEGRPQYSQTFNEAMGVKFEGEGLGSPGQPPTSTSFNTVANNLITGSGNSGILSTSSCPDFTQPGFTCEGSHANEGNVIRNNIVNGNGFGEPTGPNERTFGGPDDGGSGILMFAVGNNVPTGDTIENNQVVGNSRHGISLGFSTFCINPLGGPPCLPGQTLIAVPSTNHVVRNNLLAYNNAAPMGDPCPGSDCSPTFNAEDANGPSGTFPDFPACAENTWVDNQFGPITPDPDPDKIPGLPDNPADPADAAVNRPCVLHHIPGAATAAAEGGSTRGRSATATPAPAPPLFSRHTPQAVKAGWGS